MAEEIRLDVVAVGHNRGLDDTSRALRGVRAESDKTGKSFKDTAGETFNLDRAVAQSRVEIAKLHEEFKRTGDRSVLKDIQRQQRDLDAVMKVAGTGKKKGLGAVLDFGGEGLRPRNALIAGVVGAAAALAPMIGAMVAGAVTGAVGVGGIAGGIAMASKDARVRAAASKFGQDISAEFFSGSEAFVQPVIKSLDILKQGFNDLELGDAFGKLAPHVEVLAGGLANMARNIMPGLNEAFDRMGPFIQALADGLAQTGTQLGDFFNRLSRSEGAVMGLESLFHILNGTLIALGATLEFLSDSYQNFIEFTAKVTGALEDMAGPLGDVFGHLNNMFELLRDGSVQSYKAVNQGGEAANHASAGWVTYADSVKIAAGHQEDLNRAVEDSISNMLAQDNANIGLAQAMADFGEALKENGRNWDVNTEKGRANRQELIDAVGAADRKRQADIKMGIQMGLSAEEASARANAAYNKTIEKLKDMARKAGISEQALKDLVGDYYINVHVKQIGSFYVPPKAILEAKGRATGGPVGPGTYIVGERGPEVLQLGQGSRGHVYPSVGAYAGGRAMGGGTGNARPVVFQVNGSRAVAQAFNEFVDEVGRRGGTLAVIGIRG